MPTLNEIVNDKIDRLESVPDAFVSDVEKSQLEAFKEIEKIILQMDSENGMLLITEKNTNLLNSIDAKIKESVFNDEYTESLTDYLSQYNKQAELTNKYFTQLNVGFNDSHIADTIVTSQKNALSVLGEDAFTQSFITPLNEVLNTSINSGASVLDTINTLREFALGNDTIDGRMVSHVKRIAYDAFAVSDATYTQAVATNLELEFYLYQGSTIKDSRDFCIARVGKYFHKKEIEGWANLSWQGKNNLTNKSTIFTLRGGYNCKHMINPVSTKSVPKNVIQRNIDNGNYKP